MSQGQGEPDNMDIGDVEVPLGCIPDPKAVDISPEKNGKLWKEIIREGISDDMNLSCCDGMEVKVHYIGTLPDGTEFDRSNRGGGGSPFSFVLGEGKVIKAWDIGVAGMKKGEVCKLICHPDLAYGKSATGNIPPNSTLIFEVEMLDFFPEDLSKHKNGQLLRYKKVSGKSKYLNPNHGSLVEIVYEGKCNDVVVFPQRTVKFNLGEGCEVGVPYGVEKALYKFTQGEQSVITIRQKYGPNTSVYKEHGLPLDSVFVFNVELLSMENTKEAWQMEGAEKLQAAQDFKDKGAKFFKGGSYRLAAQNYKRIVDYLKAEALLHGEEEETRKSLLLASYLNQAICNIKLGKNVLAIRNCDDALDMDTNNPKGLYRRGLARLGVNEPVLAKEDFQKLLQIEPDNKAAIQQITLCDKKIREHTLKEKQVYSKMFAKLGQANKSDEKPLPNGMDDVCEWEKPDQSQTPENGASA